MVYAIIALMLIAVLVYSGIRALQIYIPQYNASHKFENLKRNVEISDIKAEDIKSGVKKQPEKGLAKLLEKNHDFVGWLSIEDTVIDYPVMKSSEKDPEFYLHHNFEKEKSKSGALFIGERCDEQSKVFVIYGHNMNADTMFGTLDNYRDAIFAEKHKDIVFRTPSENRVYRVFAAFQTKIYTEPTEAFEYYRAVGELKEEEYALTLENYRKMSVISLNETPKYPQQIMLLSTCAYHTDEGRFVVAAYRIV